MFKNSVVKPIFPTNLWIYDLEPEIAEPLNRRLFQELDELTSPRPSLPPGKNWQTEQTLHELGQFSELVGIFLEACDRVLGQHQPPGVVPHPAPPPQQLPLRRLLRSGHRRREKHHLPRAQAPDRFNLTPCQEGEPVQREGTQHRREARPGGDLSLLAGPFGDTKHERSNPHQHQLQYDVHLLRRNHRETQMERDSAPARRQGRGRLSGPAAMLPAAASTFSIYLNAAGIVLGGLILGYEYLAGRRAQAGAAE